MTHSEYLGLLNAHAAQTAEIRELRLDLAKMLKAFSDGFVNLQENTKRLVDEAKADVLALPCRNGLGCSR